LIISPAFFVEALGDVVIARSRFMRLDKDVRSGVTSLFRVRRLSRRSLKTFA
jgi:hypothetical protein